VFDAAADQDCSEQKTTGAEIIRVSRGSFPHTGRPDEPKRTQGRRLGKKMSDFHVDNGPAAGL